MANVVSTTTTLSPAMQRYYDRVFLERAQNMQKFSFLAIQKTVPKNSGRIVYFTRLNQLTANSTAITEGTPVTSISTSASNVIATASEYGAYEQITTLYELTTIDQGLKEHVEMMGQNAGESMDIVLGRVMNATASITQLCANSVQVTAVASTDTMSVSGIRTAVMYLTRNKAPKWENGNYRAVMHPDAIYQLNPIGWLCRKALKIILLNCRELSNKIETICSQTRKGRFNDYNTAPAFAG